MLDVFVGRQPIYNQNLEVFAYELLFRTSKTNRAEFKDADQATSQVILNTFMEIGLDNIVGEKLAFINLTRSFVLGNYFLPLPQTRIALEILEDIKVDEQLIEAVRALAAQGYIIALDDFVYHEDLRPLVDVADIIKIDVLALGRDKLQEHVTILRTYPVKLLAEKVETQSDFEFCKKLGFDYFQGYFFCQPNVVQGQRIPTNRLATLQLLAKLQDPHTEVHELELLVSQDVAMSYKLLRCINSAFYKLPRKVESIRQALVILGNKWLKTWASLILLSSIDNKPHELMQTALVRAKMSETLATALQQDNKESFFTVGLFSVLDALMDNSMEEVLKSLPMSDEIAHALLDRAGMLGKILDCVIKYERGEWDGLDCIGLEHDKITHAYLEALAWAAQASKELRGKVTH
ncbi:MAG TPA: HDOD domain-containing protein [Gammaproteobacteria bacterium]|nr:HDOD domain-containing protein [Gammaproteobacteria bacterium]